MSIVNQKIRQLMMQTTETGLASRSAVRSRDSSALQPDFRILWKVSIFQRMACQLSFSIASRRDATGKSVISFHLMQSFQPHLVHLLGNGMAAIAG